MVLFTYKQKESLSNSVERRNREGTMKTNEKGLSWWLVIIIGVLIIAAGIFLLVSPKVGLDVLIFLVGLGVLVYGVYNIYRAIKSKSDHREYLPYLVHGLLDIVLLILILIITDTPALLGIIIACWFIVFGFFDIVQARQEKDDEGKRRRSRIGALLIIIGLCLLIIPLLLSINYIILFGILALVFGIIKVAQGIIQKIKFDEHTSGGRSNLI